jgi:hypothetical protein
MSLLPQSWLSSKGLDGERAQSGQKADPAAPHSRRQPLWQLFHAAERTTSALTTKAPKGGPGGEQR